MQVMRLHTLMGMHAVRLTYLRPITHFLQLCYASYVASTTTSVFVSYIMITATFTYFLSPVRVRVCYQQPIGHKPLNYVALDI